ncbi:biotin-dependent carboxyltransferase family protein [Winogradskyella sp.]|uniref:5-oxoprolinase subunit C family protein n=1 Tax=Winogradskyella sp. TaxID=1883156 RepID=UPI003F6AAAED
MLNVIKSGFYSTIQDNGRLGYAKYGVPVSGAMDSYSSQFANALLGNSLDCATLEITMSGPTLQFLKPTQIVISGANMQPMLNSKASAMNAIVSINTNDKLTFGKLKTGFRCYVAIKNGFLTEQVFNSRSMYLNLTKKIKLADGDEIEYRSSNTSGNANASVKYDNKKLNASTLECYQGPEFGLLKEQDITKLLNQEIKISKYNNRMAYQLESNIENQLSPILTSPVLPGTVQLTPSGKLIVLMRDCQTTGGYPRLLQLTENAINSLSQKSTATHIKIRLKD